MKEEFFGGLRNRIIFIPKGVPIIRKEQKYSIVLECYNCWKTQDYYIPKGVFVSGDFSTVECANCGCKSMRKK